jgi:hypothetical protein
VAIRRGERLHAVKLIPFVLVVGVIAVGCKGDETVGGGSAPTAEPTVKNVTKPESGSGQATANALTMTKGPGAAKPAFGKKAGGGE